MRDKIEARINQLIKERQEFLEKAERSMTAYNAVISELEQLLQIADGATEPVNEDD